jgi:hypothetical protein
MLAGHDTVGRKVVLRLKLFDCCFGRRSEVLVNSDVNFVETKPFLHSFYVASMIPAFDFARGLQFSF